MIRLATIALLLASAPAVAQVTPKGEGTGKGESTEGLDMQAARGTMVTKRGQLIAYTRRFDLSGLPAYRPRHQVSGTIRLWGSNYITDGMVGGYWEAAFRKFHPGIRFEWHMVTAQATIPSLAFGIADISIGRSTTFAELELYERLKGHDPLTLDIATGSYDVPGWNPGFGVIVNKDNPLDKITVDQLDGIFGADEIGHQSEHGQVRNGRGVADQPSDRSAGVHFRRSDIRLRLSAARAWRECAAGCGDAC